MLEDVIRDRLEIILESIEMIEQRIQNISSPNDFIKDDNGIMIMDSVAKRLEYIGECMKYIEKKDTGFLSRTCQIEPAPIIRFRDFIAHHYEKTDNEIIFDICKQHLIEIKNKIVTYLHKKQGD